MEGGERERETNFKGKKLTPKKRKSAKNERV